MSGKGNSVPLHSVRVRPYTSGRMRISLEGSSVFESRVFIEN